mmetsp:Transcript_10207/g.28008  ORF Transcript_10207/g.28008 Transcript_10207/m.28008 type:complete len:158 (-) Transcript_10207:209-682(-)
MALIPLHSTSLPFFIVDVQGQQPLLLAVGNNKPLAAKLLIERGARVDSKDSELWTPLHHAALLGMLSVIELLVEGGANVNAVTLSMDTPLSLAVSNRQTLAAERLREFGAIATRGMLYDRANPPSWQRSVPNLNSLLPSIDSTGQKTSTTQSCRRSA